MGALVVMGYGLILRHFRGRWYEQYASAIVLACGALASMTNPITLQTGIIFDARAVFIALAGPFAGPAGAALVAIFVAIPRILIGGEGMIAGVAGIAISASVGVVFARFAPKRRTIGSLFVLGCMTSLTAASVFLLDFRTAMVVLGSIGIPTTLTSIVGVIILGSALEATKRNTDYLRVVEFNAERDPLTGLFNRRALYQFEEIYPRLRTRKIKSAVLCCSILIASNRSMTGLVMCAATMC
nr:LytS/YhcK type 5TM receptor domain-containing protein [Marinicella sp. W31]MDC2877966.1 LytS/YhcK type 5TM receptor domain-containing protein [Marinicella sp. W31]